MAGFLQLLLPVLLVASTSVQQLSHAKDSSSPATTYPYAYLVPSPYREAFLHADRYSAIVRFVKDVQRDPSIVCSTGKSRYPLAYFRSDRPADQAQPSYTGFEASQRSILSLANLFNYIYQLAGKQPFERWFKKDERGRNATYEAFWYSVVSSVVASDSRVFGCYVALFDDNNKPIPTVPHAYRRSNEVVVIDNYIQDVFLRSGQPGLDWLDHHNANGWRLEERIGRRPSQDMRPEHAKKLLPFTSGLLRSSGGVKVVTPAEAFWSPPVFLCGDNWRRWLISYAVPFLGIREGRLRIKGWLVLEFDLNNLEINQCANDSTFRTFYSNNVCNQFTTQCSHITGRGFTDTNFECKCKQYFHHGNFTGDIVRPQFVLYQNVTTRELSSYDSMECRVCPPECSGECTPDGRCLIKYDLDTLRALPLVIQTFCMTVCLLVAGIVFKTRRNRIIKAAVWILLEIFLAGILLLYSTVFLMYFKPTYEICFVIPWFREIGFAVTYGTLLVKIYR